MGEESNINGRPACILIVDDDKVSQMMLRAIVTDLGYAPLTASNGMEALDMLSAQAEDIDIVIMDREMPELDGLGAVAKMKEDPSTASHPVIMLTGSDKPEQVKEGIDAGVYYYLTKPVNKSVLKSVLRSACREAEQAKLLTVELNKHKTSFNLISDCTFYLKTIDEAEHLACFLANCYPDPKRVISGLAELLINSIEHGRLAITDDEKSKLIEDGTWKDELANRLEDPKYSDVPAVEVQFKKNDDHYSVRIKDPGDGFDWRRYMEIDPERASSNHGRGIAQANMISFDKIEYNEKGNEVTVHVDLEAEPDLEW